MAGTTFIFLLPTFQSQWFVIKTTMQSIIGFLPILLCFCLVTIIFIGRPKLLGHKNVLHSYTEQYNLTLRRIFVYINPKLHLGLYTSLSIPFLRFHSIHKKGRETICPQLESTFKHPSDFEKLIQDPYTQV